MIYLFFHSPLLQQIYTAFNLHQSLSSAFKCLISCRSLLQLSLCHCFDSLAHVCTIACWLWFRTEEDTDVLQGAHQPTPTSYGAEACQQPGPSKHPSTPDPTYSAHAMFGRLVLSRV